VTARRRWPCARPLRRLVIAVALVAAAAAPADAQAPAEFRGTGVVVALVPARSSLHATRPVVILQHDPIPGLMDDEMSMPFIASSPDLFRDLKPGDRVTFVLRDTPGALLVVALRRAR
jgi:Cu/Ag efflux protein CusF